MSKQPWNALLLTAVLFTAGFSSSAWAAQQVQITLNQNKAIAGGVTPGDAAGFPITLTQPGRYVLNSNLYPPPGVDGIEVKAFDVTIDFNGFILQGGGQARHGIVGNGFHTVAIQNGVVAFFKTNGIVGGNSWVIENMRVSANGGTGILLNRYGRVQKNTVTINGKFGIDCEYCLVEGNVISDNGANGAVVNFGTVLGNSIMANAHAGLASGGTVGMGNNTMAGNNNGSFQAAGAIALHPNACSPSC